MDEPARRKRQQGQIMLIGGIVMVVVSIILEVLLWWIFYIGALFFMGGVTLIIIGSVFLCSIRPSSRVTVIQTNQPAAGGPMVISTTQNMSQMNAYGAQPQMYNPGPPPPTGGGWQNDPAYPPGSMAGPPPPAYGQYGMMPQPQVDYGAPAPGQSQAPMDASPSTGPPPEKGPIP